MIGRSKINERLHDMTTKWMLLYVRTSPKKKTQQLLILIRNLDSKFLLNISTKIPSPFPMTSPAKTEIENKGQIQIKLMC